MANIYILRHAVKCTATCEAFFQYQQDACWTKYFTSEEAALNAWHVHKCNMQIDAGARTDVEEVHESEDEFFYAIFFSDCLAELCGESDPEHWTLSLEEHPISDVAYLV